MTWRNRLNPEELCLETFDIIQQNIEITDLKLFFAGENTSVLIILATTVYSVGFYWSYMQVFIYQKHGKHIFFCLLKVFSGIWSD